MLLHQLQISCFISAGFRLNDLNKLPFLRSGPSAKIPNHAREHGEISQRG
jgi:hypothetical protein